ncbi:MAG: ASKHA domain-containing protein [Planctomycetota bacterium]
MQNPIRISATEIQEARAAVCKVRTVLSALLDDLDIKPGDLSVFSVSGSIGDGIHTSVLISSGILPGKYGSVVTCLGDAAAEGAARFYLDENFRNRYSAFLSRLTGAETGTIP